MLHASRLLKLTIFTLITLCCTGCSSLRGAGYGGNLEKRQMFESHFNPGIDRIEVEQILQDLNGEVILLKENHMDDGDVLLSYEIDRSLTGDNYYMFRFSTDGYLIVLFPPNP